jgi:hypothetical protein
MQHWTDGELAALAGTGELKIASRRRGGTLRPPVTI